MDNTNKLRRLALMLMWGVGGSGLTMTAAAQAIGGTLDEIVVTATKQEQPLSKVPISVAAYTAETMDREGVRSVQDITSCNTCHR
jgi:outer membrane receptor protein involved in Fe transport